MRSQRILIACALFVVSLAAVQLSLNIVGRATGDGEVVPVSRLLSEGASFEDRGESHKQQHFLTEDMPGWRCDAMGNKQCAPQDHNDGDHELAESFPGAADPRPLLMSGVEIHKRECPKGEGADARVKLMERSAIYGHCKGAAAKKDDGPKEPREPSTARGKK